MTRIEFKKLMAIFLVCVLLFGLVGFVEAGKIKDIKKRSRASVFIPPQSRQEIIRPARNAVFFSPLETIITSGPANNNFVQSTSVEFVLDGWQIVPFKKTNRFEVWLFGLDAGWREAGERISYNLPPGKRLYTFMARAKNEAGETDRTAAVRNFYTFTSPYYGKIDITAVDGRGSFDKPQYERVTLYARNLAGPVNVSGWRLATRRKSFSFAIPSAARLFDPANLIGIEPIKLSSGDSLNVFVGKASPVGSGFQENGCMGYLRSGFEGYDALAGGGSCSAVSPSVYSSYSVDCRRFLNGLSACASVNLEPWQFGADPACRDFIVRNYNYAACVERGKNQANFFTGRWRIYLGQSDEILDDLDDTVYLYDGQGLLVDIYSY
ncbi:MAG: hypothetical protein HY454_00600 [Parcubacteria group bacterium]|nr:hypothetical protein [Parcubacteria group bacterium]